MNEIQLKNSNGKVLANSLDVADRFNKRHDHVLRDIDNLISDSPILGSEMFIETTYKNERGKTYRCFDMNRDGFSLLAMGFTGKEALNWKLKYIEAFNKMEQELKPKVPKTYKEALLETVRLLEENEKLEIENAEMKPKAEYFDELVERNLLTSFRTTANEFGIKEGVLINWLIEKKYIYRDQKNKLRAYADKNDGLFETKEYKSKYSDHAGTQTLITPKGRETFRILMKI